MGEGALRFPRFHHAPGTTSSREALGSRAALRTPAQRPRRGASLAESLPSLLSPSFQCPSSRLCQLQGALKALPARYPRPELKWESGQEQEKHKQTSNHSNRSSAAMNENKRGPDQRGQRIDRRNSPP